MSSPSSGADAVTPRVVVTGFGTVNPLGLDAESFWKGAIEGRSGVREITLLRGTKIGELLVSQLHCDPQIFLKLNEGRLVILLVFIVIYGRAGDLEHVFNYVGQWFCSQSLLQILAVFFGNQAMKKSLAPLSHRLGTLQQRFLIARQHEVEFGLSLDQLAPGSCAQRIQNFLTCAVLSIIRIDIFENLRKPARRTLGPRHRQSAAKQPMNLPGIPARPAIIQYFLKLPVLNCLVHKILIRPSTLRFGQNDPT